jgi:threonine synthase
MKFYSTNNKSLKVDLQEAVTQGLAPDNGLYMPDRIPTLPSTFFDSLKSLTFQEIALAVSANLIGGSVPSAELKRIVEHTIQFPAPIVEIEEDIFSLELFHGPTLAFKDFGARFMSQMLAYFAKQRHQEIVILVATSGDTGSAVANGFLGVEGTRVVVLYPSGKVSDIQEKQFTTLGQNVTALEVDGTFDDCQRLVKEAFLDQQLRNRYFLTSANSINIARLIPQSFYYFHAYAQLKNTEAPVIFSVPSGNFGNLTGGLLAKRMGLPIARFLAATNANDVVPEYLHSRQYTPRPSVATISNAMDVGSPSNFTRLLDLYENDFDAITNDIVGYRFSDEETRAAMKHVYQTRDYILDPHGAIGYLGLKEYQKVKPNCTGIFLETAHPAKFKEVVDQTLEKSIPIPEPLQHFLQQTKRSIRMDKDFESFKTFLIDTLQ